MASTMLTGDKRWASTRKSGMTVLGKVPKPINLPSQRLENHGLDPNVEIVPKGTLTWGSRPASSVPNVWTSSALLSPNTDGSPGSPSHLEGHRPSSGSGTRPSTAGSDKSHEPLSNAWGPNLRPSSASGTLVSNQSSIVANRPRSADARPSSSQLSRFAETPVESTVAWGPTRTIERAGPASSKNNPITLTPENFPTLGSEKTSDSRGHSSHGRPGSSSGTTGVHKEGRPLSSGNSNEDTHSDHGTVNSWKKDDYNNIVGGPSNMNWHRDPPQQAHPYTGGNIPPQHLGPWQSAPIQSPDGGWHRGGVIGGPYRPSVLPGGYPMEPYVCYPQYSPASGPFRPSSEPVPKPGAGPGGFYHPKNGESYHHHQMADSYIVPNHPVIPVRPGMYPHPVPYEGYYGPSSAGFHNPSEFGMPVRGIPNQGGAYDRANLPDPEKPHVVPDVHPSPTTKEQKEESIHPHGTLPGQYKVLLKQHDNRENKSDIKDRGEQSVLGSQPQLDRGVLPVTSYGDGRRRNHGKDDRMVYVNLRPGQEVPSQRDQWDSRSRDPVVPNLIVNTSTETDDSHIINHENATFPVTKKNASLIEKLEGLNNKARSAVGHNKGDEAKHPTISTKTDQSTSVISTSVASTGHASSSASHEMVPCAGNANKISVSDSSKSSDLTALAFDKPDSSDSGEKTQPQVHKRAHVMRGRTDHPKLKPDSRGTEWVSKSAGSDNLVLANMSNGQNSPGLQVPDSHAPHCVADVMDHKAQRTKLKEIAMRRAKELQEQEEERTREQKAKALAKLEELNRRTAAQASNQKINDLPPITEVPPKEEGAAREQKDNVLIKPDDSNMMTVVPSSSQNALPSNAPQQKQVPEAGSAVKTDIIIVEAPAPPLAESLTLSVEINDIRAEDSVGSPSHVLISDSQGPAIPTSDHHEGNVSKRKPTGSRKRSNIPKGENLSEKPIAAESTTSSGEIAILTSHGDSLPLENTTHHRKKSNRNARNKSKTDEVIISSTLPTKEGLDNLPTESSETQAQSIKAVINHAITSDQGQTQATDKLSLRMDSQWKPQSTKKPLKSQHVRTVDKSEGVMWAPVRISNLIEPSGENGKRGTLENKITNRKNEHDEQIGTRTKRAEMERYVPKAVAKELSQQSPREPLLPHDQATGKLPHDQATGKLPHDQATGKLDSGSGNILENPEMDIKDREINKLNKRGKVRPSWRQRNSAEASSQNYVEPSDQNQTTKPESQILHDDWNSNQDNLVPTEKIAAPTRNTEWRQQFVVQEHKDQRSKPDAKVFTQHPVSNLNEKDRKNASRVKGNEQVRTQWQPKSHGDGGQRISFQEVAQNENKDAPVPRANDSFHQEANRGVQVLMDQPPRRHNDRFSRGQETTYRGRVNSHLEYQPIGSHNRQGLMVEEAHSGTHGSRYRERGQPYSRRGGGGGGGNFYGPRGAAVVQTGDSCNSADWN